MTKNIFNHIGVVTGSVGVIIAFAALFVRDEFTFVVTLRVCLAFILGYLIFIARRKVLSFFSPSMKESKVEDFIFDALNREHIRSIDVIGHTGEQIITQLIDTISKLSDSNSSDWRDNIKDTKIRILIRNPNFEIGQRASGIYRTVQRVIIEKNKNSSKIHLHFYQSLPTFRAVIFRFEEGNQEKRRMYLSFYHFPYHDKRSKNHKDAFILEDHGVRHNSLTDIVDSWFTHYWGKSDRLIHTIILDFDDTIANSHRIQVEAWVEVLKNAKKNNELDEKNFSSAVGHLLDKDVQLTNEVKKIFYQEQDAQKIFDRLFINIDDKKKDKIQNDRFDIRKRLMSKVELASCFLDVVKELAKEYNLIIVSATDEVAISRFLEKKGISELFWYIFGKREQDFHWTNTVRKSRLLYKVVNVLGIPIEHIVYIGDNNGDYVASTSIGVDFIEARLFKKEVEDSLGRPSLISEGKGDQVYFTSWASFMAALDEIERGKYERIRQFPRK